MASTVLPLFDNPYYSYSIDIDNEAMEFTFRWNNRAEQWMMSIADSEDNVIIRNVPVVPAYPLLQQFSLEKPVGDIFLIPVGTSELYEPIPNPRKVFETHFLIYDDLGIEEDSNS